MPEYGIMSITAKININILFLIKAITPDTYVKIVTPKLYIFIGKKRAGSDTGK